MKITRGENFKHRSLKSFAMPNFTRSRYVNSVLMGAGAVLGGLHVFRAQNPALRDSLALSRDQLVLAGDFHRAMGMVDDATAFDIAPDSEEAPDKSKR